jgi:hypothetical protein
MIGKSLRVFVVMRLLACSLWKHTLQGDFFGRHMQQSLVGFQRRSWSAPIQR